MPRLRAPQEHGQILAVPPLDQVGPLLQRNHVSFDSAKWQPLGRPLSELRKLAQVELLAASVAYHQDACEPAPITQGDGPWIVAGHQPELFHPGVWFKNFVLHQLARDQGGISLNLLIDSDTAKPALLPVPSEGRLLRVPFDRSTLESPYEERVVEEEDTFRSLPERFTDIARSWKFEPMLPMFWREVMAHANRTPLLGERFAAARRAVERRWGMVQRELPMSRVCGTEAFAWFAVSILDELPSFHATYNQSVQDYRLAHGIRSRSHPVPDLAVQDDWLEAPFWAWRTGQRRRGKLFVRRQAGAWQLRVGTEAWPSVSADNDAVGSWRSLESRGYKVRSRALTTTLFARLFLADLFIHGIGGGIYDELTDRLIERHFKLPAPGFLVVSATLLLPLPRFPEAIAQMHVLGRRERDLMYNPERFVAGNGEIERLVAAKREWIAREGSTHAERVDRFHRIREINTELHPFVQSQMGQVRLEMNKHQREADWNAIHGRRDFAFCLFPEDRLKEFFKRGKL